MKFKDEFADDFIHKLQKEVGVSSDGMSCSENLTFEKWPTAYDNTHVDYVLTIAYYKEVILIIIMTYFSL